MPGMAKSLAEQHSVSLIHPFFSVMHIINYISPVHCCSVSHFCAVATICLADISSMHHYLSARMQDPPSTQAPVCASGTVPADPSINGSSPSFPANMLALQLEVSDLRSELRAFKASDAGKVKRDAA